MGNVLHDIRIQALRAKLAHNPDMNPADSEEILSLLSQQASDNELYRLQVVDREERIKRLTGERDDYCQRVIDIESGPGLWEMLDTFRALSPAEFTALSLARDLPHSGIHDESFRTPGQIRLYTIKLLLERKLIEAAPQPGYYTLSDLGKRLMGKSED